MRTNVAHDFRILRGDERIGHVGETRGRRAMAFCFGALLVRTSSIKSSSVSAGEASTKGDGDGFDVAGERHGHVVRHFGCVHEARGERLTNACLGVSHHAAEDFLRDLPLARIEHIGGELAGDFGGDFGARIARGLGQQDLDVARREFVRHASGL